MERPFPPTNESVSGADKSEPISGSLDSFFHRRQAWFRHGSNLGVIASWTSAISLMFQGGPDWNEWYVIGVYAAIPGFTLMGAYHNLDNPLTLRGDNKISHTLSLLEGSSSLLAVSLINAGTFRGDVDMLLAGLTLSKACLIVTTAHTATEWMVRKLKPSLNKISAAVSEKFDR